MSLEGLALLFFAAMSANGSSGQEKNKAATVRLAPCPSSPNCVSTLAEEPSQSMPPLAYDLPEDEVIEAIREVIEDSARARIVSKEPAYLHAEFRSLIFRFVDDVEFALDPTDKTIHFRSASRMGYSDLGANRKRMEGLRKRLAQTEGITLAELRSQRR